MADLYVGFAVILIVSAATFYLGCVTARRFPSRTANLTSVAVVLAVVLFIQRLWYDVSLVEWLPYGNLVVLGNWLPVGAAFLAGVLASSQSLSRLRRCAWTAGLTLVSLYALASPILGEPPHCLNRWDRDGICIQTTNQSCSAACAATLLRLHGIPATENEMAELCLTRTGTTWLGLYRGLKRKTSGTNWDVAVVSGGADEVLGHSDAPMIWSVGLPSDCDADDRDRFTEWGWRPGQGHSVVFLRMLDGDSLKVADPTPGYGTELWSRDDVEHLFRGIAFRLVRRS